MQSPDQEDSLERIMQRYQAADSAAALELVERVGPPLFRFFLVHQFQRPEADDLVQETWLRIHRSRHTWRPSAPALPWIFAIARHVCMDALRKRYRSAKREVLTGELPDVAAPDQHAASCEQPSFEALIDGLPDSQKEVLTLLKVNGLSLEEVAGATHSTVGAVKQKASRAYARLRTVLSRSIEQDLT